MTPAETVDVATRRLIALVDGVDGLTAKDCDGVFVVSGLAVLPVAQVSASLDQSTDLEVVDEAGQSLATLCFAKEAGAIVKQSMTKWQYAAYLSDVDLSLVDREEHVFQSYYLVVEESRLDEYIKKFKNTAPLWGRFSHSDIAISESKPKIQKIVAVGDISFPTKHHIEVMGRYLRATNALERYLRLYQSIELIFDFVVFMRIKGLGDNLEGFSEIITEHGKSELDRLKAIMRQFCGAEERLAQCLEGSSAFKVEREEIFFKFGKGGDPVANEGMRDKLIKCIDTGRLNRADAKADKLSRDDAAFRQIVVDTAAYWIYRVRCSIAHNRVGEFVLEDKHSEFIVQFAEPLILEAATQIFTDATFRKLSGK